jgi:hypothetical protein
MFLLDPYDDNVSNVLIIGVAPRPREKNTSRVLFFIQGSSTEGDKM